jgi:hypothetical protein
MFLNIMYYDLKNETEMMNSTNTMSLSFGSFSIEPEQVNLICLFLFFDLIF